MYVSVSVSFTANGVHRRVVCTQEVDVRPRNGEPAQITTCHDPARDGTE